MLRDIAFWLGALLVILWAFRDFNRGLALDEIRSATQRDRYLLGGLVYGGISFFAYTISAMLLLALYGLLYNLAVIAPRYQPLRTVPFALAGVLIVIVLMPETPILRGWTDTVRNFARSLALYPMAYLRIVGLLGKSKFLLPLDTSPALEQKLRRYGAPLSALSRQLSPSVYEDLFEVQLLRDRFRSLGDGSEHTEGRSAEKLRWFLVARKEDFEIAERNYQRLIRRVAQVCALDGVVAENEPYPLSDFVVHSVERLLFRYRTLIAQAALSCFVSGRGRKDFIQSFGYSPPSDWLLPFWPLLAILLLDVCLFLAPTIFGDVPTMPTASVLTLFLAGHALAQVFAVSWAIFPKATSNFARPSLRLFPWRSYIVFGLVSYVVGASILVALNYVAFSIAPETPVLNDINPYLLGLVFSLYFPVITVCLSFLTDLYLRGAAAATWISRSRDSLLTGSAMGATHLIVRALIYEISGAAPRGWTFLYITVSIGALIGLLVPSTSASYLSNSETRDLYHPGQSDAEKLTATGEIKGNAIV